MHWPAVWPRIFMSGREAGGASSYFSSLRETAASLLRRSPFYSSPPPLETRRRPRSLPVEHDEPSRNENLSASFFGEWPCSRCTFVNEPSAARCGMCQVCLCHHILTSVETLDKWAFPRRSALLR
jgi:hypothetical protein